jgi:tight adherence protein B
MTAADLAALIAGMGVLMLAFAAYHVASHSLLDSRMRIFVQRAPVISPMTMVRKPRRESKVAIVEQWNKKLRQGSYAKRVQINLVRAGIEMQASRFIMIQAMAATMAFMIVWFAASTVPDLKGFASLGLGGTAAMIAWYVPSFVLKFMEGQRLKKLERQLPTTIDSMAGALQAGSSLAQAMEMASREVAAPIGKELGVVVREMAVGVPMQDAFNNMLERCRSMDLDMLVTAIAIQHRIGGNLSQILRNISHTIRERLRIKGEISVLTAQQRMSGYIVSALPLCIIGALFVIAPTYIAKLFLPGIARIMLVVGAFGMLAGFYALKRIADIDV